MPLPVRGYPRVGDHDGLQVEAAVTQIPAGEEGELQEVGDDSTRPAIPQPVGCGGAGRAGRAARGAKRGAHAGTEQQKQRPGAAPSLRLVIDVAASISNRISSQQLHFKAFHSAALME